MIVLERLTQAEIDVMLDALLEYQSELTLGKRRSRNTVVRAEYTWRLHVAGELVNALAPA